MKICSKCKELKTLDCFHKDSFCKGGYKAACKQCRKLIEYTNKKEYILNKRKQYYLDNKEKFKFYHNQNRYKINKRRKERLKNDINFKLAERLRIRLYTLLKFKQKQGSAVNDLGCSLDELKLYLESKFQPGMTWENWGRDGWHIDHIKPLASFNLSIPDEHKKACHYTNLQPLWAVDNLTKNKRF